MSVLRELSIKFRNHYPQISYTLMNNETRVVFVDHIETVIDIKQEIRNGKEVFVDCNNFELQNRTLTNRHIVLGSNADEIWANLVHMKYLDLLRTAAL